jgi:predicted DsbA family dithiol-disulfide isomerase
MQVEMYSDCVCPWCFIGKRRFDRARQQRQKLHIDMQWRAFELNPALAPGGMDRDEYLLRKFGDATRLRNMHEHLREIGVPLGIRFRFDLIRKTPNTRAAHTLLAYAAERDRQDELSEALFSAYFEEGRDIGDPEVLVELGSSQGFDSADSLRALNDPRLNAGIQATEEQAREWGISGVPTFIFERRYAVSGAQPAEVFTQLFDRLAVAAASA